MGTRGLKVPKFHCGRELRRQAFALVAGPKVARAPTSERLTRPVPVATVAPLVG